MRPRARSRSQRDVNDVGSCWSARRSWPMPRRRAFGPGLAITLLLPARFSGSGTGSQVGIPDTRCQSIGPPPRRANGAKRVKDRPDRQPDSARTPLPDRPLGSVISFGDVGAAVVHRCTTVDRPGRHPPNRHVALQNNAGNAISRIWYIEYLSGTCRMIPARARRGTRGGHPCNTVLRQRYTRIHP